MTPYNFNELIRKINNFEISTEDFEAEVDNISAIDDINALCSNLIAKRDLEKIITLMSVAEKHGVWSEKLSIALSIIKSANIQSEGDESSLLNYWSNIFVSTINENDNSEKDKKFLQLLMKAPLGFIEWTVAFDNSNRIENILSKNSSISQEKIKIIKQIIIKNCSNCKISDPKYLEQLNTLEKVNNFHTEDLSHKSNTLVALAELYSRANEFKKSYEHALSSYKINPSNVGLQAICNSLIKGGRISDATAILASLEKKIPNSSETTATDFNDGGHAKKAFKDLIQALHNEKLEPFLISGTLLGWVRNRNLLPHDKDIDIGLISSGDHSTVRKALINSKNFSFDERVLDNPNAYLLQLKHKETKTHADIFFFHEKEDCYIHGIDSLFGYTQNFRFSKFKTSTVEFLDENVKIPDDYDLFLRENYGDQWKIPDKNYIVNLESPALTIKSGELYRFIAHLELLRAKKNPAKRERILNIINAHEA